MKTNWFTQIIVLILIIGSTIAGTVFLTKKELTSFAPQPIQLAPTTTATLTKKEGNLNSESFELHIDSPSSGDTYVANDSQILNIKWRHPTQLVGKYIHRDIYLVDSNAKYFPLTSTSFQKDTQIDKREDSMTIPVSTEIGPGTYQIYIWVQDYATSRGYGIWSGFFTVKSTE